ncbi:hypothetical protein GCM10027299_52690 [Larkinella ripae]
MKKQLLGIMLLLPLGSWAQTKAEKPALAQGQFQVGVSVGAGWGNAVGGFLRATPYAQYFLKNNWALRLEGRYNYNGPNGNQYLGAGLLTQYHFLRTDRLSVFGQAGYFYGQAHYRYFQLNEWVLAHYRDRFSYGMAHVGVGARYHLGRRWSVNALIEKNLGSKINRFSTDGHSATLGLGFRIK